MHIGNYHTPGVLYSEKYSGEGPPWEVHTRKRRLAPMIEEYGSNKGQKLNVNHNQDAKPISENSCIFHGPNQSVKGFKGCVLRMCTFHESASSQMAG